MRFEHFDHLGIHHIPDYPKKYSGQLVIVGSGRCVWDDLADACPQNGHVMCLNDMIMHLPMKVDHAYSNDHHMLPRWIQARRPRHVIDYDDSIRMHTCEPGVGEMFVWPWPGHGDSGLGACYTAIALGYERIVLAGVPCDNNGHYFDPPFIKTNYEPNLRYWKNAFKYIFKGKVSAMSGNLHDIEKVHHRC